MDFFTRVGLASLIGLMGMAWPAAAQDGRVGIECATRSVPRRIAPNHFVLDRITHCAHVGGIVATGSEAKAGNRSAEAAAAAVEVAVAPTADELPYWSPTRDRMSNRQYARSLREFGPGVRSTSR